MAARVTKPLPGTSRDPNFPDSDGMPMGETDFHISAIIALREMLQDHFADTTDVLVASNMLLYCEISNARYRRDPDVFVARGVGNHQRRSFRTWEEGTVPCAVFEVSSEKTWEVDLYDKPFDYARLGIGEYFLFDPETRFLNPPLQGFRLSKRRYAPIRPARDGSLTSKELGLRLKAEDRLLRLYDAASGEMLLTRGEQVEEQRLRIEEEQRRVEEERRRADENERRAEEERRRAEEKARMIEQYVQHIAALEEQLRKYEDLAAEVERLKKMLRELEGRNGGKG